MAGESIGILGGTFDPIHRGHIRMAQAVRKALKLDRVLILPSGNPPHKTDITPAEDRWRMVCTAVAPEEGLEPCRAELDRDGVIYTVDTLRLMKEQNPGAKIYYIIGTDTLMELKNWRQPEQVMKLCTFAVCPRQGAAQARELLEEKKRLEGLGAKFVMVDAEPVNVSSTRLRQDLSRGAPTPLLPETVREYAGVCGLYGMRQRLPMGKMWIEKLFDALSMKRFSHSLAVAWSAWRLAQIHGVDRWKAETAALLHDCAKCLPLGQMQAICTENHLTEDPDILKSGALMHSIAGAWLAEHEYGLKDPDMLRAIRVHTTGCEEMTPLDMVVFLADKIEPTRKPYPALDKVRITACLSLERAMLCSLEGTRDYVKKGAAPLHPQNQKTIDWLKKTIRNKP